MYIYQKGISLNGSLYVTATVLFPTNSWLDETKFWSLHCTLNMHKQQGNYERHA